MSEKQQNFLDLISKYWFLILFLGGMAVTWGSFQAKDNQQEARITILEARIAETIVQQNAVNVSLGRIETSLQFIREKLNEK